jgi:3-hydroxyisobutyrate dehydrogenase-like beta-hydroxyacid dehydrogenase
MKVGFLGLGSMGIEMARNLLEGGNDLSVWNRSPEKAKSLAADGANVVESPVGLASCDVVFAMLANDDATRESIVASGLLAKLPTSATFVNCATISLALARELVDAFAEAGVAYVAAPVLGRPNAAAAAQLNVIVAGDDAAVARVEPLLAAIGHKTWRVGSDPVQANVAKIGANFLIAGAIGSMSEAFALCEGNGLAPRELFDIVTNTLFAAPAYKNYGAQILDERFEPAGFALRLGRKDVGLAQAAGTSAGAHLPLADTLGRIFDAAIEAGDGDKDWSAIALRAKGSAQPKTS